MARSFLARLKRRGRIISRRRQRAGRPHLLCVAIPVGAALLLAALTSIHLLPDRVTLQVGDRSPLEIRSARSTTYVDSAATARSRQFQSESVPRFYDFDQTALASASNTVTDLFKEIRRVRTDRRDRSVERKAARLSGPLGVAFRPDQLMFLVSAPDPVLDNLETTARRLVEVTMAEPIHGDSDDLQHARQSYDRSVHRALASPAMAAILQTVGAQALRPNYLYDLKKTALQRDLARRNAPVITGEVRAGEVIIEPGDIFTQQHLDKCAALGLVTPRLDVATAAGVLALSSVMVLLTALYIRRKDPALYRDPKRLFLLAAIVIGSVFGLKIFGTLFGIPLTWVQFGYLGMMAVVAAGMLIAVLLGQDLAILVTALLAVQSGLIINHEVRFCILTMVSGLVGIYSVAGLHDRMQLLRTTASLAAVNIVMVWVLGGVLGDAPSEMVTGTGWGLLAAGLAIAVFWFGVAILEKPFGILTHVWLLELSSSERPLLRQLCVTAPGTYAHSIMVGNLAEAGAEAIGGNALFCRVASYYHDVGKMRKPHCFIENQRFQNIHDRLQPSLSALIIASHVRDGLLLADEYHLPRQIKDVIAEHHGTSLIRYFYHQCVTEIGTHAATDPVLEQHFRYDGPRPQTRESGIIMLADSVEAAARSLDRPTPARIQGLVESLIHEKLVDGQLDECDLTFKDIRRIQAAFVRVLTAMLHRRIEYPDLPSVADLAVAAQVDGSLCSEPSEPALTGQAPAAGRAEGTGR